MSTVPQKHRTRIQLNVEVDPRLMQRISRVAAATGRLKSRIVREALVSFLDAAEKGERS
ncbi:hypothetical protein [Anaeromyxobacter dehalogenans]|uniref:hypothetical protein n=1 Tax=Anaeromyxobacter dehalogenans TaxID=161493 RepID=UPI0002DD390D|nr:hypothetical protein [Anaeromyxobacter dehalogenans]